VEPLTFWDDAHDDSDCMHAVIVVRAGQQPIEDPIDLNHKEQ